MKKLVLVITILLSLVVVIIPLVMAGSDQINYHRPAQLRLPDPQVRLVKSVLSTPLVVAVPTVKSNLIEGFFLGSLPIAMVFHTPEGDLVTNWAQPWQFDGNNEHVKVEFDDLMKGTIFVTKDQAKTIVVKAHSGYASWQQTFAFMIESYIRLKPDGNLRSSSEASLILGRLIGNKVTVCQMSAVPLTDFKDCSEGKVLKLVVVAATIIKHKDVFDYDDATATLKDWLVQNYPDHGFETLEEGDSILSTCLGLLNDQMPDDTHLYLFNRFAFGLKVTG